MAAMTRDEILQLARGEFRVAADFCELIAADDGTVVVGLPFREENIRPGGTLSGPSLMTLADIAAFYQVLAHYGPMPLAVTSSMQIQFLHKPQPRGVVGVCVPLKYGGRSCVCRVSMYNVAPHVANAAPSWQVPPGAPLLAEATLSYALPATAAPA